MRGPGACPQVESLAGPLLVPVGWESRLALRVRNLQHFQVSDVVGGEMGTGGWGGLADNVQGPDGVHPQGLSASYHCWLELPGELRRLPASLEEMTEDTGLIYCQAQQVRGHRTTSPTTGCLLQPADTPNLLASDIVPGPQGLTLFIPSSRGLLYAAGTRCPQPLPQAHSLVGDVGIEQWHPFWEKCPGGDRGQGFLELGQA